LIYEKKVCSNLANDLINTLKINEDNNYNNNWDKPNEEELVRHYLKEDREEHIMLKIFNKLLDSFTDQNQNTDREFIDKKLDEVINDIKSKPEFDLTKDIINKVSINERFIRPLIDIVSENNVPKKVIKVLEINLSNAIMAAEVESHLACAHIYPISVDYTIANKSIENLHEDYKNKSFKLIEWDHKQSSFPSEISSIDLIIYRDCQELWHLKLNEYLKEVFNMIASNGFLLSVFRYKNTEPESALYQVYKNNSPNNLKFTQRINDFRNAAQEIGFQTICCKTDSIGSKALLFRKVIPNESIKSNEQQIIEINGNYEKWLNALKDRVKQMNENKENNNNSNIWLIGNDSSINGIIGLTNCLRQEPGGEIIRCIFDYDKQMKKLDFSSKPFSDILTNDLAINVIRDGKLGTYRHLSLPKNHDKIETNDYFLNVVPNGDLSSLQWFDSKNLTRNESFINFDNRKIKQIRCNVYYNGLNFHDVMLASGIHLFDLIIKFLKVFILFLIFRSSYGRY
jgi:fatty acid synthase